MQKTSKMAIMPSNASTLNEAQKLALRLNLPLATKNSESPFLLIVTSEHLELQETTAGNSKPIFVDFLSPSLTYRIKHGGGKKQLLAKAIGVKKEKPVVVDATAGFGVDAFILASLGCEVLMLERSPIVGALLEDGLANLNKTSKAQTLKLTLQIIQATDYLTNIIVNDLAKPDVVYLDPMYPKRDKLVLNKKTMRILHELIGDDSDAAGLLTIALKCAKKRVVVKRPKYATALGELKPDLQFSAGGSCRYDVYFSRPCSA